MDAIKKQTEEIESVCLQMTGLVTLMSVGGSTQEKISSLNRMYNQVEQCSANIMSEVKKIIEYNQEKQRSMRKDLAASKKRTHKLEEELEHAQTEVKKLKSMEEELEHSKTELSKWKSEFSFIMDDMDDSLADGSHPLTSTPVQKIPVELSPSSSTAIEGTSVSENDEKDSQEESPDKETPVKTDIEKVSQ
jgi:chromosome segregation ATPase